MHDLYTAKPFLWSYFSETPLQNLISKDTAGKQVFRLAQNRLARTVKRCIAGDKMTYSRTRGCPSHLQLTWNRILPSTNTSLLHSSSSLKGTRHIHWLLRHNCNRVLTPGQGKSTSRICHLLSLTLYTQGRKEKSV